MASTTMTTPTLATSRRVWISRRWCLPAVGRLPPPRRPGPRGGRPPGGPGRRGTGRRSTAASHHHREIQTRRLVASVVVVVVVLAMALLIHSCDSSQTTSALKNYNASVYNLINQSDATGSRVFQTLTGGNLATLNLAPEVTQARAQLRQAQRLNVPSGMADAQGSLVQVMQLRVAGIHMIAAHVQQAASVSTSQDAVYDISVGTSELYSSDVIYKEFVTTAIASALHADGIAVGSGSGQQPINPGQVVPDLGWLESTWIATKIGADLSTQAANANNNQPGLHGDALNYVTVDGTQLVAGVSNTIPARRARRWVLNVTNTGNYDELDVGCSVHIVGAGIAGSARIPVTIPSRATNCTVLLASLPKPGTYTVTARISRVPRQTSTTSDVISYSVTFN